MTYLISIYPQVSHPQQVYHHPKEGTPGYPPTWYRIDTGDQGLADYSNDISSDMHHHSGSSRDPERPFKAYPRTPVTLPGPFYGSQPAFPSPMAMSSVTGGDRDYPQVTSTCSSAPTGASHSTMSAIGHPLSQHPHHHPHLPGSMQASSEGRARPSPDSQSQGSSGMMEITSSMSMKGSPESTDHLGGQRVGLDSNDSCPDSNTSSAMVSGPSSSQDCGSIAERAEANGFRVPPKKRPHNVPDVQKDECYWEKRKKNNESAKRSREARRVKEEQIAMRVVFLEQENLQLRTELSLLKNDIEKLRCMLYNP